MGKAYSVDLRTRVLADYDDGVRPVELAKRYRVARSWIYKLVEQRQTLGHIEPLKGKRGPKPKLGDQGESLKKIVAQYPDDTLEELRLKLPLPVSITTVWRALHALKLTFKKSHSRR
jgi:transposase